MTDLSRVVWREGMHLGQHHFQLQQRYFEDSINVAVDQLFFKPYGLISCTFDGERLRNGVVSVLRARGLLPDGTAFSFPDSDVAPVPLDVRALFSPTERSHVVYLALPARRNDSANVANDELGGARMRVDARPVRDETTGGDERTIEFAVKNLRVCLGPGLRDGEVALPIARLLHAGIGQFLFDDSYIPPIVTIGASETLLRLARGVVDRLDAKREALASDRRASGRAASGYSHHEAAAFWLLHALNTSGSPLRHMLAAREVHPEPLYLELSRLAGALCTFVPDAHPLDLPLYEHDDLETCFTATVRLIRERLDWAKPTNFAHYVLEQAMLAAHTSTTTGATTAVEGYRAAVPDDRAYDRAEWILGIRAKQSPKELIGLVPRQVKVCSANTVSFLVAGARSGFELSHLSAPPPTIATRSDTQYFGITRSGPCDKMLTSSREIGVYIPESIHDPQVELFVVYQ